MQYSFIYQALLEHYLYGDTELDVSSLERHLQTLQGSAARFDRIGLEEEFRVRAPRPGGERPALPAWRDPGWGALPGRRPRGRDSPGLPGHLAAGGCVSPTGCVPSPGQVWPLAAVSAGGGLLGSGGASPAASVLLAAETDQRPDHEGEHEDGQPAGQHEEGQSHPDHPV